jgi:integrase/recombinase XerD
LREASWSGIDPVKEATVRDPKRVRVTGPLAGYAEGFADELLGQGYTSASAAGQVQLLSHMSRWATCQGLSASDLTPGRVEEFLEARRAQGYTLRVSQRGVAPLVGYLRRVGVVPTPVEPVPSTPAELLIEDYRRFLVSERGLAASTICSYLGTARLFLSALPDGLELEEVSAGEVTAFVVDECRRRRVAAAKVLVTGLRSLLRFLFLEGYTARQLAPAVPTATGWGGGSLPRALDAETVAALLASCDRCTRVGRRDFAILTMLARLGLRAGEVAGLELDDVDWHHGEIVVRGKGGRQDRLPLPADVGEAVVTYLRDGRPPVECRALFVRVRAPITGLTAVGVGDVVVNACGRAGLPRAGAHRLRHSAATAMLRGGASLVEIGQALRQVRATTTAMYAKVDRGALRALAQPWPGGGA